ncbi:MAG: cytidine deaminase [Bacteroidetes bacterium 46-16]|mgnify:CR=1 FL=1|nr:MAG: cytidine deaminase [Bacteroidetes bacterium 46-16]
MQNFQFPFERLMKTQLPADIQQLVAAAEQVADKAYAPYSHFKVGAALLMEDGSMITGSNHENASYPVGICAERAALATLDMNNNANKVRAISVTYKPTGHTHNNPVAPCGMCRQAILEVQQWQGQPIAIYMYGPDGEVIYVENAAFLLPFAFGGSDLNADKA